MLTNTTTQSLGKAAPVLSHQGLYDTVAPIMIRLVVREVAERAGIKSARDLSIRSHLPYESCRLLWNGDSRMIGLGTLERLCTLLDVPPGQLFDFKPEPSLLEQAPEDELPKRKRQNKR